MGFKSSGRACLSQPAVTFAATKCCDVWFGVLVVRTLTATSANDSMTRTQSAGKSKSIEEANAVEKAIGDELRTAKTEGRSIDKLKALEAMYSKQQQYTSSLSESLKFLSPIPQQTTAATTQLQTPLPKSWIRWDSSYPAVVITLSRFSCQSRSPWKGWAPSKPIRPQPSSKRLQIKETPMICKARPLAINSLVGSFPLER